MRLAIFGQQYKDVDKPYIDSLLSVLGREGITHSFYEPYYNAFPKETKDSINTTVWSNHHDLKSFQPDFLLSLGGDGTILRAVTYVRDTGIPIMGINLGRLGFLAIVEKKMIAEAIQLLSRGMYHTEQRTMLYLESNDNLFGEVPYALNDFTMHKRDTSSMMIIHTFINGDFLNSYWADGIIVASPTGSTGYSLSCGGPIIFPNSGNLVITPVAPHNLNVRPIVLPDDSIISFELEGRSENFLCTLDSRYETISANHQLAVRKCSFPIHLIQLHNYTFLKTIHEKLSWGIDQRNE